MDSKYMRPRPVADDPASSAPEPDHSRYMRPKPVAQESPTPLPGPEPAPIDSGTAGASAQREHDRRAGNREARVKDRFGPRVGGFLVKVVPEPQHIRAWEKGAVGERKLAAALTGVAGVVVLHDRRVRGTVGNIDHIVIAPGGVFVVDAKHYKGLIEIRDKGGLFRRDYRLYVGRRDHSVLVDNMGWQVKAVEKALVSAGHPIAAIPVLCFIDAEWPLLFAPSSFRSVKITSPRKLRKLLCATPFLDAADIDRLARVLAAGFPAK